MHQHIAGPRPAERAFDRTQFAAAALRATCPACPRAASRHAGARGTSPGARPRMYDSVSLTTTKSGRKCAAVAASSSMSAFCGCRPVRAATRCARCGAGARRRSSVRAVLRGCGVVDEHLRAAIFIAHQPAGIVGGIGAEPREHDATVAGGMPSAERGQRDAATFCTL